jgi:hypothetical protein
MKHTSRAMFGWTTIFTCTIVLAGCGEPDFSSMKPGVYKPTAEVYVVQGTPLWQQSDIEQIAAAHGVTVHVESISQNRLTALSSSDTWRASGDMMVFAMNQPIPDAVIEAAKKRLGTKFEVFGTSKSSDSSTNVKQVVPDVSSVDYALGFLAGVYATTTGNSSIGWLADASNTTTMRRSEIQTVLGALYAANPSVQVRTVTFTDPFQLPSLLITPRPLTETERQVVQSRGVQVISLCPQTENSWLLGEPKVPSAGALDQDFRALANSTWQPGTTQTRQAPLIWMNQSLVPQSVQSTVESVSKNIETQSIDVNQWGLVPANVQLEWNNIVMTGQP